MASSRLSSFQAMRENSDAFRLGAMFGLYFLVITTVGILRPVRNVLALDGLADTEFYKTYFVSAIVVLFAPIYNRIADRVAWRVLIPGVAFFFAASFVVFRILYVEGSAAFGMAFYGWYDLYAAALVTQFFIATQLFFNAREAKKAYPLIIAGGSIGASLGGTIVGLFSTNFGTPNFLLVAAGIITVFGIALFFLWFSEDPEDARRRAREKVRDKDLKRGEFGRIFSNPQVRLIAAAVLLTVLTKQLVDYSFNTAVGITIGDRDSMGQFQGFFMAATQWTPILVLAVLRPALGRWGIGIAVFMLPVVMLITNSAVALAWGLWTTVIAKGSDGTFRYSAERTGREILYVPVPDEIKLKAKAWIDVGVEKGVGKASSALLLLLLVSIMDYRKVPFVAVGLSILGLVVAYRVRREYVQTLRKSIEGRFASLEGVYASIMGASTLPIIRQSLADPDPLKTAFALDLMDHAGVDDVRKVGPELHQLLSNRTPEIRLRVLGVLAMVPDAMDTEAVRGRLLDSDPRVREAAVRALAATTSDDPERVCSELLAMDDSRVRAATLACLATDMSAERAESVARPFFEARLGELAGADADHRLELALAAAVMRTHPDSGRLLARLFADPDGRVASAAMRSAGFHDNPEFADPLIDALGTPQTRFAAREALTALGQSVLAPLIARLNDERADARIRRNIPPVLAGIPSQETVGALIHSYELKETDQWLDNRSLRALTRLRRNDELVFEEEQVLKLLAREVETAGTYAEALAAAGTLETGSQSGRLLERALREARYDRRESSFRWLALLYPLQGMYRSYLALRSGDSRSRANALEWLESTVGHKVYAQLAPVVERPTEEASETADAWAALRKLWDDEDHWVARCAIWAMCDHRLNGVREELQAWQPEDPEWLTFKTRMLSRVDDDERAGERSIRKGNMDLIEKVFLLQSVDLLQEAGSAQLALMASIAEEVDSDTDEILIERGDPTDALYVVIRGEVELHGVGDQRLVVEDGSPFGTWALIDEEPSLVQARTTKPTRLLRIGRRDFDDLLADYPELGLDLLQGLARRVRTLVRS